MQEVEVERAYRIVGAVDKTAKDIEEHAVPFLQRAIARWRKRTLWGDAIVFGAALIAVLAWIVGGEGLAWLQGASANALVTLVSIAVLVGAGLAVHYWIRSLAAKSIKRSLAAEAQKKGLRLDLTGAFARNTRSWRSIYAHSPAGWGAGARRRLHKVREDSNLYIQTLNDRFTNPSGDGLDSDLGEPEEAAAQD
jgi:hypothetical protein